MPTSASDCRPQFTSSIWSQLCEMLNIMHHQTTAYHPEANSAVKRLHYCLKDALRAWAEELPWVLLGLHSQPGKVTGLSHAKAVLGVPLILPNEFLHAQEFSVESNF